MIANKANLYNAVILIVIGFWGYLEVSSPTALIPFFFGVILLLCSIIISLKPNLTKLVAHIAVLFTIIILVALAGVRLPKSLDAGGMGLIRVLIMIFSSSTALVFFVKNFIDNKKKKS